MYAWIRGYHLMHTWWKWEVKYFRFPGLDPVKHQNSCWLLQTIHMWLVKGKELLNTQSQGQCQHLLTGKPCTSDRAYLAPGVLWLGFFTATKFLTRKPEPPPGNECIWFISAPSLTERLSWFILLRGEWHPTAAVRDGSRLGSSICIWPVGL